MNPRRDPTERIIECREQGMTQQQASAVANSTTTEKPYETKRSPVADQLPSSHPPTPSNPYQRLMVKCINPFKRRAVTPSMAADLDPVGDSSRTSNFQSLDAPISTPANFENARIRLCNQCLLKNVKRFQLLTRCPLPSVNHGKPDNQP